MTMVEQDQTAGLKPRGCGAPMGHSGYLKVFCDSMGLCNTCRNNAARDEPKRTYWTPDDGRLSSSYGPSPRTQSSEEEAMLVSSLTESGNHAPVIDLDIPARLVASSTYGHSHLYIDTEISWTDYYRLLKALYKAGLIEKDYFESAQRHQMSFVRKQGVLKTST